MAPLSSNSAGYDEVIEIQHHLVHLNTDHHHKTLVESINSLLHVGASANGSHHPGSGAAYQTDDEVSEDLLIVLFTCIPLIAAIVVIFFIAVAIRKMRRSESLQEVQRRNEFKMSSKTNKGLHTSFSNPLQSFSLSKKAKSKKNADPPSPMSLHEIRVVQVPSRGQNRTSLGTQLSLESTSSTSSNGPKSLNSPNSLYFSQVPPWYLYSTPYYRSQYHLNKLHRQLSNHEMGGSLQSLGGSMQSLNQFNNYVNHSSSGVQQVNSTTTFGTTASSESEPDTDSFEKKKKSSKKLKKVFQMMNIPKRIRQHQAEKNRFNIYTIPNETREQLKQIYVY